MRILRNFSIGKKLGFLAGIAACALIIIGILAINQASRVKSDWDNYQSEVARRQKLLSGIKSHFGYGGAIHNFKNFVLRNESKYAEGAVKNYSTVSAMIAEYGGIEGISGLEKESLKTVAETARNYFDAIETARGLASKGLAVTDIDKAVKISDAPALEAFNRLTAEYERMVEERTGALFSSLRTFKAILGISIVISLAVLAVTGSLIGRAISRPVIALAEATGKMAEGDLTQTIDVDTSDEAGVMASSFNAMSANLNSVMNKIRDSADFLAAASEELLKSASNMSEGAAMQSSGTANVAGAMVEMNSAVGDVAVKAQQASEAAKFAQETASKGGEVVAYAKRAMKDVSESTSIAADTVRNLGKRSEEIGTIVSVINDIADQTNLLALNAAIEAARAGEQGRGFAVVADEVKKLSERTTKATKGISEMIRSIQDETTRAVAAMSDGALKVENGVMLANDAGDSLRQIISTIETVTGMIGHIATSADEQSAMTGEMSRNMDSISEVARTNDDAISGVAQSVNKLARLSAELKELVSGFKIDRSEGLFAGAEAEIDKPISVS